jgi:hypothetical protein
MIEEYGLVRIAAMESIHKKQMLIRKEVVELLQQRGLLKDVAV